MDLNGAQLINIGKQLKRIADALEENNDMIRDLGNVNRN